MIRVVICGIAGRMGGTVLRLARESGDIEVIGGIDRAPVDDGPQVVSVDDADAVLREAAVVIDFSSPDATDALVTRHADALAGRALAIGTTGLGAETRERIRELGTRAAVLTAANFSLGINLLTAITERIAGVLEPGAFDIEIIESHHRRKVDAPSGTAIALGEAAARGRHTDLERVRRDGRSGNTGARTDAEIGMHAVRGGGIAGEHRVIFAGEREVIELRHEALDRAVFAEGAIAAARWLVGREPGQYTMQHVLGL